jgi:hypothetical protein
MEETWMESTIRENDPATTREGCSAIKESKMKFERKFGWDDKDLITIEAESFEKILVINDFIEFQEYHGWGTEYKEVDCDDDEFEEDAAEEVIAAGLDNSE